MSNQEQSNSGCMLIIIFCIMLYLLFSSCSMEDKLDRIIESQNISSKR